MIPAALAEPICTSQLIMELWFEVVPLDEVEGHPSVVVGMERETKRLWGVSQQLALTLNINITTFNSRCTETYIVSDTYTLNQLR